MFRCTVPGGYVELVENGGIVLCDDGTMKDDNLVKKFFERMAVGMEKIGRLPYVNGDDLKEGLQTAGFVDVTVHRIKFPMAPWPKDKRLKQVGAMVGLLPRSLGI